MNIQQLRYVVAIANSGTFREAAAKLFVSQPSLSVAVRDLETELGFQIFTRTTTGAVLTNQGMTFYENALEVVKSFDSFEKQFSQSEATEQEFSIASQHYDFLPPLITAFSKCNDNFSYFRIFESTTIRILDEVAQGNSEIGIIYI
ncbi:LysR family transcriptional regulator, partial [Streptococcus agalactiae]|nr:LysR family transcriptional regulator [Streptococcus agalactiae]MCC9744058.1 LysR family transcriptional regulator [Streptococcus agalactiae]MCD0022553.1 LysR family transcriptional regulator [Streptococcus agalactiae]